MAVHPSSTDSPRPNLDVQPLLVHSPGQPWPRTLTMHPPCNTSGRAPPRHRLGYASRSMNPATPLGTHPHQSTLSMQPPKRNPLGTARSHTFEHSLPFMHLPRAAMQPPPPRPCTPRPALTMLGSAQRRPQEAHPPPLLPTGQSDAVLVSLTNGKAASRGGAGPLLAVCSAGAACWELWFRAVFAFRACSPAERVRVSASCVRPVCCTCARREALQCPRSPAVAVLGVQRCAQL